MIREYKNDGIYCLNLAYNNIDSPTMTNIIIYSKNKVAFSALASFKNAKFIPVAYGILDLNRWFVYGHFDHIMYSPENQSHTRNEAVYRVWKKAHDRLMLINICDDFERHVNCSDAEVVVENGKKCDIVPGMDLIISQMSDKKYYECDEYILCAH